MTSRRSFLAALASAIALDPERALWVPGAKLISVPAPALVPFGWSGGITFGVGDVITFGDWPHTFLVKSASTRSDSLLNLRLLLPDPAPKS